MLHVSTFCHSCPNYLALGFTVRANYSASAAVWTNKHPDPRQ